MSVRLTQLRGAGRIPSYERYNGPLWETLRTVDPDGRQAAVAFLSAHFGFRSATEPIAYYDARLTPQLAERMAAGGMITRWPEHTGRTGTMPGGSHPGAEIASLADHGRHPFSDVALVGGQVYLIVMRCMVAEFQDMRQVTKDARIIEINVPIGLVRSKLREWLCEPPGPVEEPRAAADTFAEDDITHGL